MKIIFIITGILLVWGAVAIIAKAINSTIEKEKNDKLQ